MKKTIGVALILHIWLLTVIAIAQPLESSLEIDGLLLDQTKTRAGHEFFCRFSGLWDEPASDEAYNVLILENTSPQWGSVVLIKVNDVAVFQSLLKPRDSDIRELAVKATDRVKEYVRIYLKDGQKIGDDDLAANGW